MKTDIHPTYNQTNVTCACGNTFATGSTAEKIDIEVCSQCHPFYTGKEKVLDTAGRVEKFKARQQAAKEDVKSKAAKKADKKAAQVEKTEKEAEDSK